jgi:nucleoid-associated protein YgaU
MALEKLSIVPFSKEGSRLEDKRIFVLFNPNSYSITKSVTWSPPQPSGGGSAQTERKVNAPTLQFGGGGSRQLTLELFFDVTEPVNGKPPVDDVRKETDKIVKLTHIDRNLDPPRPPTCEVAWGDSNSADFPFVGVVSNLTQKFTLFKSTGKPVRANLTVVFVEFLDPKIDLRQTDPELTTRVVKRGDTLSSIAGEMYRNPTLWRIIAEANQIDDPRRLQVGRRLTIPKLR